MNPSEVLRISWEAILKNKVRTLLTMLGVIIGVAAVIIMIAISSGTEATIQHQIPNVAGVSVEQDTTETVKAGNVSLSSIAILGSLPDFLSVRGMSIASG